MWCVVCVVYGVCPLNTSRVYVQNVLVCTGTTRTYVSTCARGASIHGDVLDVHTGTCRVDTRRRVEWTHEGIFIRKTSVFTFLEHLNWMLGSSLIANFLLTKICPHMGCHVLQRFTKSIHWILPILRMERGQLIPTRRSIIGRSALARCNILIMRSRKDQGQGPPRQRHVDNNTPHHTTPHHTTHHTTPQPTNQPRAAHDMTRHNDKKKQKHTRTRI